MAREVFTRRSSKAATRTLTVSTENVARRALVDPGDYPARITAAKLIEPRGDGNISVILELIDPESGDYFDVRPLWVAGPTPAMAAWPGATSASSAICSKSSAFRLPPIRN